MLLFTKAYHEPALCDHSRIQFLAFSQHTQRFVITASPIPDVRCEPAYCLNIMPDHIGPCIHNSFETFCAIIEIGNERLDFDLRVHFINNPYRICVVLAAIIIQVVAVN